MDQYQFISLIIVVFGAGAGLALFFSRSMASQSKDFNAKIDTKIDAQTTTFNKKIDDTSKSLEHRIEGLDIVAKADRVQITNTLQSFDDRDRVEHKEMLEQITQVRIAVGALETNKQRERRTKKKS